jgi:hypothetical protein
VLFNLPGLTEHRFSVTAFPILKLLAAVFGLTQVFFLIDSNFSHPKEFQESDYVMTFYVAGHLSATGRESELYPTSGATSFAGASFDKAAHDLLPDLPKNTTAIYMYSPLLALFFAPLSFLSPTWSVLLWQALSLVALFFSCKILARSMEIDFPESFLMCALFGPVFIMLWSGQLGLVLGVFPLCLGYFFLLRNRALLAGLIWSVLLLKPQYLPSAVFVGLVFALNRKFRLVLGLVLGVLIVATMNLLLFSPELIARWLTSHELSDTLFTDVRYGIPAHLVTSIPADILLLLRSDTRLVWKWPIYFGALSLWFIGLCYCWKICRAELAWRTQVSLILAVSCVLSSLALPHLLYYDLCILIPGGFLFATTNKLVYFKTITSPARLGWFSITLYLVIFVLFKGNAVFSLILELILLALFLFLIVRIDRALAPQTP